MNAEPDEIPNLIEEVVDLARQTNLGVDDVQEHLDYPNQELTIDEFLEMHENEKRNTMLQNVIGDSPAIYLGGLNSPTRELRTSKWSTEIDKK
ncbi:hypothetical protein TNCV_4133861 [Trichonephila clavipes]|uniref:Uncharacterized protein n=1 Tax=Trichonephila clavipes TaxID=2585209 RepID=A0A8X6VCQ9_TRICX|nr:hypothetical protein TNCV_4133861 [Trichonephila clavipes]